MKKTAKLFLLGWIAFQWVAGAWLGIMVQDLTPSLAARYGIHASTGALVLRVQFNSPARTAGLQEGDLLLSLNHEKVSSTKNLKQLLKDLSPGNEIEMIVLRARQKKTLHIVLGTTPRTQV